MEQEDTTEDTEILSPEDARKWVDDLLVEQQEVE